MKIKIFADGPDLNQIKKLKGISGYTFNPSLFRKLKVQNYLNFTKKITNLVNKKPVSIEVIGDDNQTCFEQAKKISIISNNIFIKIPIIFTNGKSSKKVIKKLHENKIKLNITAIFTYNQCKEIYSLINNKTPVILSIFAGRLYDIGIDPTNEIKKIKKLYQNKKNVKLLWASCRMPYDIKKAENIGCHIITMPIEMISKLKKFNSSPLKYSQETVKQFYLDAKKSNFKI